MLRRADIRRARPEGRRRPEPEQNAFLQAVEEMESHPAPRPPRPGAAGDRAPCRGPPRATSWPTCERQVERRGSGAGAPLRRRAATCSRHGATSTGWALTPAGERLRRIYHECDLLLSLAIEDGAVRRPRRGGGGRPGQLHHLRAPQRGGTATAAVPHPGARAGGSGGSRTWPTELASGERGGRAAARPGRPSRASSAAAWPGRRGSRWTRSSDEDLSGGDFVRNVKQLIDLLRQLGQVARRPGHRPGRAVGPPRRCTAGVVGTAGERAGMTIRRGAAVGRAGRAGRRRRGACDSDAARRTSWRGGPAAGAGPVEVGLLGGDLRRTLGAPRHDEADLPGRSWHLRFPVDLGLVDLTRRRDRASGDGSWPTWWRGGARLVVGADVGRS